MTFNSLTFLLFFGIVLGLYHCPFSWKNKKRMLLVSSYLFYAAWNPPFIALLWLSTLVDWVVARRIYRAEGRFRSFWLLISLCTNLGVLAYFKYGGFLLDNFVTAVHQLGIDYAPAPFDIILPMGISFYTFQTLSYTLDIYWGKAKPASSFLDYALFVTFFPQLVAGPIVRAVDFLPQCTEPKRATGEQMGWGLVLLIIGLFQKMIIADKLLAPVVDQVYANAGSAGFAQAWIGTMAFSGQIFCDFSGYSCCGIGIALCLGFALPDNFRFPYAAVGFSDFWRRWHISLSSWLRDYLYIPLGGNRQGSFLRGRNLMLTMLIGGLWHGAGWHFVAWGGLHGLYLMGEAYCKRSMGSWEVWNSRLGQLSLAILTYLLVCLTWVFFRAPDFSTAFTLLQSMFLLGPVNPVIAGRAWLALMVVLCMLMMHWILREKSAEEAFDWLPDRAVVAALTVMILCLTLTHGENRGFIYFQF